MKNSLSALPCFIQVENISTISSGLSQSCFKISADNQIYFAKTISDNTEVSVTICASKSGLSPNVIYHDQHWLISNFIDANNLALNALSIDEKIHHTIKLMVQCHQLNIKPAELAIEDIVNSLVSHSHYSTLQKTALLELANLIIMPLNDSRNGVCCHGDLNFSNVLINQAQSTWLIDYGCACTAPIEYDLAMFIAVNNLTSNEVTIIIKQYELQSSLNVDPQLLNHYLLFCYFMNALWYFNAYKETMPIEKKQVLLKQTKKQWLALQSALKVDDSPLLSRLSSKLTNILATFDLNNQT
ncbi:MAG: hypothetical protein COA59_08525 [Colwellia sp.]|nr:MAG: hypothetical protein COA59_08525 [Colwellia sp.]